MRDPNAEILKELRALRASVDRTNALLEGLASRNSGRASLEKPSDPFTNVAGLTDEQRARMTAAVRGVSVP